MFRYRSSIKQFLSEPKDRDCPFCNLEAERRIIAETPHVVVLFNKYPYDIWEYRDVVDHLMVVPKRHVSGLRELSKEELADIMQFIAQYEHEYNVYMRSVDNVTRSVAAHQHTHLIKTDVKPARVALYLDKPYFVWKK